jgi:methylated-DNA-protein-cysteine methyltransferase-like protein
MAAPRTIQERIYRAVMRIPRGKVATYGQVGRLAGLPRHHRQVGRALRLLVDDGLVPWHRVVGASGAISLRSEDGSCESLQCERLEREGVRFDPRGRVPLARYQWKRAARS